MKKTSIFIAFLFLFALTGLKAQNKFTNWPALGEFHEVMSATFHPSEKGDFEPVKKGSQSLVAKASILYKSIIPANYSQPKLKSSLKLLVAETKVLDKLVQKKSEDADIQKQLIIVHDRFHEIIGLCKDEAH